MNYKRFAYEGLMITLAFVSVATIWYHSNINPFITWSVWFVFFLDFTYKFFTSKDKWGFIKKNPFLLIAIIPLDAIFQFARFARIIHLFRLKTITKHYTTPIIKKLKKKRLSFILPMIIAVLFLSTIPLYYVEPEIHTFKDAFISSIVSLIFFGSTTVEPVSIVGKTIMVSMTVFGVILHGLLITIMFDWFLAKIKKKK